MNTSIKICAESLTFRRLAAGGFDLAAIKAAIKAVSKDKAKNAGFIAFDGDADAVSHAAMAEKISGLESYGGGYMYSGDYATINGVELFDFCLHYSNSYDVRRSSDFIAHNAHVLNEAKIGSELVIGHSADCSSQTVYRLTQGGWRVVSEFCGRTQKWADDAVNSYGYFLYAGIRADVAILCGYEVTEVFHIAFDMAIDAMQ